MDMNMDKIEEALLKTLIDVGDFMQERKVAVARIREQDCLEGATAPCGICGEYADQIPARSNQKRYTAVVPLPHDHEITLKVTLHTTRSTQGAICGRCVTFTMLSMIFDKESWYSENYIAPCI